MIHKKSIFKKFYTRCLSPLLSLEIFDHLGGLDKEFYDIKETTLINKINKSSNQNVKEYVTQVLWYIWKLQITEVIFNEFSCQDLEIILDSRIGGLLETVRFIRFEGSNDYTISNELICLIKNKKVVSMCYYIVDDLNELSCKDLTWKAHFIFTLAYFHYSIRKRK